MRLVENSLRATAATVSFSVPASTNQSNSGPRCTLRRDRPSTFSNEALANMQRPSGETTATMVARWSKAA